MFFSDWLLSLGIKSSGCIVVVGARIPLSFQAEEYSIIWIDPILFALSCVDGHLSCFHFLTVMNSVAMNVFDYKCLCGRVLSFLLGSYLGVELLSHAKRF